MASTFDRRDLLKGTIGLGAAAAVPLAPALAKSPVPEVELIADLEAVAHLTENYSRSDLIRALTVSVERYATKTHHEMQESADAKMFLERTSAEQGFTNSRTMLVSWDIALMIDILDECLSLSYPEKLEMWNCLQRVATSRVERPALVAERRRRAAETAASGRAEEG
jgi:hypothetical protein